jgi:hypothetical protein
LVVRLIMLILTLLAIALGGIVPFYFWGKHLKQEALQD